MKIKDINKIYDTLNDLYDFMSTNTDSDTSGIREEMTAKVVEAERILKNERYKLYLRNAKAKIKRERK